MSAIAELRRATRARHEALEAQLDLVSPTLDLTRYAAVMAGFGGIIKYIEPRLDAAVMPPELNWPARRKLNAVQKDLAELGISAAKVTPLDVDLSSQPALLGVLYVIEGSTLGGQYISAHVSTFTNAVSYFSSYGEDVSKKWAQFRDVFNATVEPHNVEATQAANKTFAYFAANLPELRTD